MLLLQFSTSHYCRKARLALGYKGISYKVKNLTPGLHLLEIKPLTGLSTVPVLLPEVPRQGLDSEAMLPLGPGLEIEGQPKAIGDSTQIFKFLESYSPTPELFFKEPQLQREASLLEDWLDESIGTATRFVYYHFRAKEGKGVDPSLFSQAVIRVVRWQYGINEAAVRLASDRLASALEILSHRWQVSSDLEQASRLSLVGDRLSIADLAAAALLSPLALIPQYRKDHPWLFQRIGQIHQLCNEPLPPGLEEGQGSVGGPGGQEGN